MAGVNDDASIKRERGVRLKHHLERCTAARTNGDGHRSGDHNKLRKVAGDLLDGSALAAVIRHHHRHGTTGCAHRHRAKTKRSWRDSDSGMSGDRGKNGTY